MAYTTSSNLITAMQTNNASIEPYVKVGLVTSESGGTTIVTYDSDDRVIYLRIHEETWEGEGEVWLDNQDNGLTSYNYAGRRIHLHFGYEVAGGGDETVQRPDMWVISQRFHTEKGRRYLILYLIDIWLIMSMQRSGGDAEGKVPAYNDDGSYTETIQEICAAVLITVKPSGYASGVGLSVPGGNLDVDGLGSPDLYTSGIFKEYEPYVLTEWNTPIRNILRDLLRMTEVRLRTRQGGSAGGVAMGAHWLDTTDAADWTIESAGTSNVLWISRTMEDPLVLPNKVIFVDIIPDVDASHMVVKADATNAFSVARIGTVGTQLFGPQQGTEGTMGANSTLDAQNEVALRANMIMFDIELETDQGALRMRPHVGFQLLDMVQVNDALYGTGGFKARVGIIEMAFDQRPGLNDFPWNGYYADIQFGI